MNNKLTQISISLLVTLLLMLPYSLKHGESFFVANLVIGLSGVVIYHVGLRPSKKAKDFCIVAGYSLCVLMFTIPQTPMPLY